MTYEEKYDAVQAFCDKYESLIDEAPEGSDLWAFRELVDSFDKLEQVQTAIWMDTIESIKVHLINAMLHIAEKWSNETEYIDWVEDGKTVSIELECVDPATGETTIIGGKDQHNCSECYYHDENGYCSMVDQYIEPSDDACGSFKSTEEG